MEVGIQKANPPYVTFEYKPEEDRDATIAQGRYTTKDVAYAIITPAGSKDRIPKPAEPWLTDIAALARQGNYPQAWVDHYKGVYAYWKAGEEIPENGVPVKNWPIASPNEIKVLLELNIRTVEEVAAMNEESILRMGMGGRKLKQLAHDYLTAGMDSGKMAGEMQAMRTQLEAEKAKNIRLEDSLMQMSAKVDLLLKASESSSIQQPAPLADYVPQASVPSQGTPDIGALFDLNGGTEEE